MTIMGVVRGSLAGCLVISVAACTSSGSSGSVITPTPLPPGPSSTHSTSPAAQPHSSSSSHAAPTRSASSSPSPHTVAVPRGGPVPAHFVPISTTFVSADDGWVLGTAPCAHRPCASILRTRDGGRSWRSIPSPQASEGQTDEAPMAGAIKQVRFANQDDGWVGAIRLYSTHDGGATWHRQSSGNVTHIETGGGYVFVTTGTCTGSSPERCTSRVYGSPIGHDAWRAITPTLHTGASTIVSLVVHGASWFASAASGVYRGQGMSFDGRVPQPCPRSDSDYGNPKLAAADAQHLDALCVSGGAAGTAQYELFGSTDGGRDWRQAGGKFRGLTGDEGIADNAHGVLLLAESSAASRIVRTADDGATYARSRVNAPSGGIPWSDLGFTTPSQAVVVLHDSGMYLSHDAGRTFTRVRF